VFLHRARKCWYFVKIYARTLNVIFTRGMFFIKTKNLFNLSFILSLRNKVFHIENLHTLTLIAYTVGYIQVFFFIFITDFCFFPKTEYKVFLIINLQDHSLYS
jgi:hypothetical protein